MNARPGIACLTVFRWSADTVHPTHLARLMLRPALLQLDLDEELLEDVLLAASELVANATEHAASPYELRLMSEGCEHILECHDRSRELPPTTLRLLGDQNDEQEAFGAELMGERGRGLRLLSFLFYGCLSARRTALGKTVFIAFGSRNQRRNATF